MGHAQCCTGGLGYCQVWLQISMQHSHVDLKLGSTGIGKPLTQKKWTVCWRVLGSSGSSWRGKAVGCGCNSGPTFKGQTEQERLFFWDSCHDTKDDFKEWQYIVASINSVWHAEKCEFDFLLKWTFKDFVCVQGLEGEALLVSGPLPFTPYFPGLWIFLNPWGYGTH